MATPRLEIVREISEPAASYREVLTDRERYIFEALFGLSINSRLRKTSLEELAEDYELPLFYMKMTYHDIVAKMINADVLDSALELE